MGVTAFNGNTGYRGVVKIEKGDRPATRSAAPQDSALRQILATSGSFNLSHQAIYSSGVWGAGYMNASERVAYANDIVRLDGSVGLEYTAGDVFLAMQEMCFKYRGHQSGTYLQILPNGYCGFKGFAWATSLSFSASQGAVVTGDFNWTSYLDGNINQVVVEPASNSSNYAAVQAAINSTYGASGGNGAAYVGNAPFKYNGLYPYWATDVEEGVPDVEAGTVTWAGKVTPDIIDWSASYDSSIEQLKCCGTSPNAYYDGVADSHAPLAPDYLGIGAMNATCNMTIFKLKADFKDDAFHNKQAFRFILHTPAGGAYTPLDLTADDVFVVELPRVVNNSKQSQIQTGSSWITGSYAFDALGDFKSAPLNLKTGAEAAA